MTIREDQPELFHYLNGIRGVGNSCNFAYLAYMAIRLLECHRVLKPTGSIYLHCDPTMSHYLKALMDCIFGEDNFRNEIVWKRRQDTHNKASKTMGASHDTILWYGDYNQAVYRKQFTDYDERYLKTHYKHEDGRGKYRVLPCTNETGGNVRYNFRGLTRAWRFNAERMEQMHDGGLIVQLTDGGPFYYKKYLEDAEGVPLQDLWLDISPARGNEQVGYPTQKPLALLDRIIKASSNEGDVVLDPFCGCATTCVAAERLGRQWVGIDVSFKAYDLVRERLTREAADPGDLLKYQNEIHLRTDPPTRTDLGKDHRERKFVYVISHPSWPGEYKVGIAKNWKSRLDSYQTSDPDRQYRIEFKLETPRFRETERHIHEVFPNKHEWVEGDLEAIRAEITAYAGEQT